MTAYGEPGRDVDMTEIERARIHEQEETKRKLISEREETKRKRIAEVGFIPSLVWGLVALAVAGGGTCAVNAHYEAKVQASAPCIESTEIIDYNATVKRCVGGAHVETEKMSDTRVLMRCRCSEPSTGASAFTSAKEAPK